MVFDGGDAFKVLVAHQQLTISNCQKKATSVWILKGYNAGDFGKLKRDFPVLLEIRKFPDANLPWKTGWDELAAIVRIVEEFGDWWVGEGDFWLDLKNGHLIEDSVSIYLKWVIFF